VLLAIHTILRPGLTVPTPRNTPSTTVTKLTAPVPTPANFQNQASERKEMQRLWELFFCSNTDKN
jgi:hypothetical protein